ncbi:NADH:flavorubredoxin reductase NorW [Shewanella violacea]|uniref:Nitric oxide reductase FlRd-NAD(+) reductase n=1 Tax=Shewanella violacea (strain JCM 10179 / CIP 106290 / LMG 19151 / DSS12) TaxID=637905 RepID=D4ZKH6_SHEVD|nr:NADH:flavorubredoxin reductase NorW [Shewanella violacea]BAJ02175.1 nitric oxide reductase FlRd-NAD(+) reductase [Shewanella violacea DSS12]
MSHPIIIIGSGFAAYQLIKTIRRSDSTLPIWVFTRDDGHDYNKPDLSHVFSKQQGADELITKRASEFADEFNITLYSQTRVEKIDVEQEHILVEGKAYPYSKLVLATGAKAFVPPIEGDAVQDVLTLNSLSEYASAQQQLSQAQEVLLIGAGLIGCEIAMDLSSSGKQVTLVDPQSQLMANLLPEFVAAPLHKIMTETGISFELNNKVSSLSQHSDNSGNHNDKKIVAKLNSGKQIIVDAVISVAGLKANLQLAQEAGLATRQGIVVNAQLQTSANNVYALGDCAEIEGQVKAYLQPILLSANTLAKVLQGQSAELKLPPMLVKVKTPLLPIQLSGQTVRNIKHWQTQFDELGSITKAYNDKNEMVGFIVTQEHMKQAFPLLRELSSAV